MIYCSSPNCKNECGKKYNHEDQWRNPHLSEGILFKEYAFCDNKGNKIKNNLLKEIENE